MDNGHNINKSFYPYTKAAERRELSGPGVCMIDQSAAYDLLDHYLFPEKLKEYNFDEATI